MTETPTEEDDEQEHAGQQADEGEEQVLLLGLSVDGSACFASR